MTVEGYNPEIIYVNTGRKVSGRNRGHLGGEERSASQKQSACCIARQAGFQDPAQSKWF